MSEMELEAQNWSNSGFKSALLDERPFGQDRGSAAFRKHPVHRREVVGQHL